MSADSIKKTSAGPEKAEVIIVVSPGQTLPEPGKLIGVESLEIEGYKYAIRVQKIYKLDWVESRIAVHVRGIKIE